MIYYSVASAQISIVEQDSNQDDSKQLVVMELHATQTNGVIQEVRHYPPQSDRLRTTYGDVEFKSVGGTGTFEHTENLSVNGTSVSLSLPPVGKPILLPDGNLYDENGNATSLKYTFDGYSTFEFNQHLTGNLFVSYTTAYSILEYTPKTENGNNTYGEIMSWYKKAFARFKVPPPDKPGDYDQVRFAAVVRKAITDSNGLWEHHEGFPEQYYSGTDKPDEDAYSVDEIDVFIWYAQAGRLALFTDKQGWEYFQPKKGSGNYKPQFYFKVAQRPTEEWAAELYDKTDFNALYKTAQQLYSNIKLEGN